jgi:hypothetical protein
MLEGHDVKNLLWREREIERMTLPEPPRCGFPSCTDWGVHEHHITYEPPVTKRLCVRHHEEITIINGQQARKYRRSLSNKHRWWIWFQWIEGKLNARRTRKALEYTEEWAAGTTTSVEETPVWLVAKAESKESNEAPPPKRSRKRKKRKARSTHQAKRRTMKRKGKGRRKAVR